MKTMNVLAFASLVLPSVALLVGPAHAALSPWSQRVVELHAVLDAGALALAGSGEVIVSVTYQKPDYLIRTEHCTVVVVLAAPEALADENPVPFRAPGNSLRVQKARSATETNGNFSSGQALAGRRPSHGHKKRRFISRGRT